MSRILIIRKLIKISYYRISENFLRSIDLPRPIVEGGFSPSLPNIYPVENSQRVNRIVAYASRVQNALQRVCTREQTEYAWYVSSRKRRPLPSSCVQQLYRDFSFNRDTNLRRYERNENPLFLPSWKYLCVFLLFRTLIWRLLQKQDYGKLLSLLIPNNCKLKFRWNSFLLKIG